jgi:hypothetical protein
LLVESGICRSQFLCEHFGNAHFEHFAKVPNINLGDHPGDQVEVLLSHG